MTGVAEAGEVDRRIQIPIYRWASVAAAVDAVAQPEFGFHPAAPTQLSRREEPWRAHQFGAIPAGLVVQLGADPPQRGIAERPVEAAFAPPTTPAHVLRGQLLDRNDLVAGSPARWWPGGSRGRGSRPPWHESGPPGRWPAASVSTAPGASACRDRRGRTGAPRAVGPPAAATAPGSRVWAPRCASTSTPSGVATTSRSLDPDIHTHHPVRRSAGVAGSGLAGHDHLKRALPAPTSETHRGRQDPRRAGLQAAGQLAGRLMRTDPPDPRQHDMVAIGLHANRSGGEPHRRARGAGS